MADDASALGIDLGTSTAKAVLIDASGRVRATASAGYAISAPRPGWAEQAPEDWRRAATKAVRALAAEPTAAAALAGLRAIGLSGQMHGTVVLNRHGAPPRPAIIWADGRSAAEAQALNAAFRARGLSRQLGGAVAPGFMAATLAWLRANEPETWGAMTACVLPKDALRGWLTGGPPLTEASDAASTLLLDLARRDWSAEACALVGVPPGVLPPVRASGAIVGSLTPEAAEALGLPAGVPVIAGGSDQGMALLGAGVVDPGTALVSLSTGGQIVAPLARPMVDPALRAYTFCHVLPGQTFALAATLSAGLSLRWLREQVLGAPDDAAFGALLDQAAALPPGADGLLFWPYLLGERTPHMDARLRAAFAGLGLGHGQAHLLRAVLEGVAFSLREALAVLEGVGARPGRLILAGGGARLPLWRQILADVLGRPLQPVRGADQSALGAALLAGHAAGIFPDLASIVRAAVDHEETVALRDASAYAPLFARYQRGAPLVADSTPPYTAR